MITIHIKDCNYRKFLLKALKDGRVSGKFYKFLCRNFPYRLTYYGLTKLVAEVLSGKIKEEIAIYQLKTNSDHQCEIKYQKTMVKSNIECRKKIGAKIK
jgi:hypothetical protein